MSFVPIGWSVKTFGEVLSLVTNGMNGKQNKEGNGIPVSRIETIADQCVDLSRVGFLAEYDEGKIDKYRLEEGDILFSHINSPIHLGKTALVPADIVLYHGVNLLRLKCEKSIDPRFFNYYCKYLRALGEFSKNAQHAVNQSSINQKKLKAFELVAPSLEEQKLIADKLDSVLAKVEAAQARLDKIPAILKRFRQSVLAAATSGELTKEWRGGEPFMADDIVLKEVVEIDIGHAFKSKEFEDKGIRLLRGQNIEPGALRWSETKYFPKDKLHKFSHLFIRAEDIILAMDRPIVSAGLKLAKAKESDLPCVLVQRVARFSPSAQIVNDFLYYLLLSPDFSSYLLPKQTGSDIPHISGKQILNYSLKLPHIDEQKAIVAMVSELFEHASSVQKQYRFAKTRLDKLTQSILAKAFRGELLSSTVDSDIEAIENSVEALNA